MTRTEAFYEAKRRLRVAGIDDPSFDTACLFEKHTGIRREQLPLCGDETVESKPDFWRDVERRANGEPLQYILGEWEFMGLPFLVGPGVLIPRQDTELLAETAIDFLRDRAAPRMLELCAGTGCVTIAAAKAVDALSAVCIEISPDAIVYLNKNVKMNYVQNRVQIICGNMLDFGSNPELPRGLDLIVCNPPYIRADELPTLQREVRDHEPALALDGGDDGLTFYRAFAPWAALLRSGGMAAFEVGAGQAQDVVDILRQVGFADLFIHKDYAGIERVVGGYKK